MNEVFQLIAEVGFPIAGAVVMGYFIFIIIKQLMAGVVGQVETLTKFCESLENRARTMSNEMIKIDMLVSSALELRPDIERVARAEARAQFTAIHDRLNLLHMERKAEQDKLKKIKKRALFRALF